MRVIDRVAKIVNVTSQFKAAKEDSYDDIVVRTAFDGKADYIVTGDKHLLSLETFRGPKILTADEMLTLVKEKKLN